MPKLLVLLLLFSGLSLSAAIPAGAKCPVCRMPVTAETRTSYQGEGHHFCSYSCAHAFHKKKPAAPLFAHDFKSGEEIPAAEAWFVVKSEKIAEEVEFGMAPIVAAFKTEQGAKEFQGKLKDGRVVHGLDAVDKAYEK